MGSARAACLVAVALSLVAGATADAAPLRLDGRFGEGGIARVPVRTGWKALARPLRPVRQPDGRVLVAAAIEGDRGDPMQVALARFTRNGRPDPTFGRGGRVRLGWQWNFDPREIQLQPDGRIVLMGAAGRGINTLYPLVAPAQTGLIRLLPDGSPDPTFSDDGFVAWNPPWRGDSRFIQTIPGLLLLRQTDGRLVLAAGVDELRVAAPGRNVSVQRAAFVRFNRNGSVDPSFGVVETPDSSDYSTAWAALPDGHLVALAARSQGFGAPTTWWLHRFHPDGTIDRGFGQDGSVGIGADVASTTTERLVAIRDGSLVLLGNNQPDTATVLYRILPGGQLDAGFGSACSRPPLRAFPWGGAATTSDGGVLVSGATPATTRRGASPIDRFAYQASPLARPRSRGVVQR